MQRENFEFFILAAMGVGSMAGQDQEADYFIVVNGPQCTPCQALYPLLQCAPPILWTWSNSCL